MEDKQDKQKKQQITHVDYKDITRLGNHINPHARMFSRKRTGFAASQQRSFARAIKRARFMALLPFVSE